MISLTRERLRRALKHYLVRVLEELWKLITSSGAPHQVRVFAGRVMHRLICRYQEKQMSLYTRFFRNPPQLEALAQLALLWKSRSTLLLAVLGCSTGAEAYSAVWVLRSARPDLRVVCVGLDTSEPAILAARRGIYANDSTELKGVSEEQLELMFDRQDGFYSVKETLREGVSFLVGDACDKRLVETLGLQDIVMGNNFLIHLPDRAAEACLHNLDKLVAPGGALAVWGVDLDIKTRAVNSLKLKPFPYPVSIQNIYEADERALAVWPLKWWGLEPLDKARRDWIIRYCTVFRKPEETPS